MSGLRAAAATICRESCREDLGAAGNHNRCGQPAEFVLWGKLFKPQALGPRCYDHAAQHAGHRALGDPSYAIIDLRPLRRALEDAA